MRDPSFQFPPGQQKPFAKGDPRAREAGSRGGAVTAHARRAARAARSGFGGTVLDVADAAGMVGPSWSGARSILRAAFALPQSGQDVVFFRQHTNREHTPAAPVSECWLAAG